MAINFPANPSINDTFIVSGTIFTWTGVKWKSTAVTEISSDTTPQLGGNLDLNSRDITGTGNINVTGIITSSAFVGDGSGLKSISGTTLSTYASASDIAYSAKSIVGFSSYSQVGILTAGPTNLGNGDNFGRAVAMSANGKTLFVGAPDDEINGAVNSSGAVYVFERVGAGSSFNQLGILTGSSENGQFGESIACSADGKTVVVNAVWDANDLGLAYVFDRSGDTYTRVGILSNSIPDPNNYSGPYTSADISADGKLIILANEGVQPPGMLDDTGAVFVWKRDGNTFNEVGIITNRRNTASSEYSESIAISGDGKTIVVGALSDYTGSDYHGSVSIFDVVGVGTNLSFNNVGILTGFLYSGDPWDAFGCSVDINYDGSSIIVGDFRGEIEGGTVTTGTAHVYDRVGDTYSLVQTFTGSQSVTNGSFGNTVVMSPDGKQMLVAARGEPADPVYKFERYGNTITQVGIITAYSPDYTFNMGTPFDKHLAMSADAKSILIGYEDTSVGGTAGGASVVYDQVNQTSLSVDSSGNINIVGIISATNIDLSSGYDKTFELHSGSTLDVDLNVPGPYLMIGDGTSVTLNFTNASTSTVAYSKEIWLTQDASASDLASSGHTVNGSAAGSIVKTGTMNGSSGELDVALVRLAYYGSEWKINIFVH